MLFAVNKNRNGKRNNKQMNDRFLPDPLFFLVNFSWNPAPAPRNTEEKTDRVSETVSEREMGKVDVKKGRPEAGNVIYAGQAAKSLLRVSGKRKSLLQIAIHRKRNLDKESRRGEGGEERDGH